MSNVYFSLISPRLFISVHTKAAAEFYLISSKQDKIREKKTKEKTDGVGM